MSRLTDSVVKAHVYSWLTGACSCGLPMPSNYHYGYHVAELSEAWLGAFMTEHRFEVVEAVLGEAQARAPYEREGS